MSIRPYTDDDLLAEAAAQHHELTTDPDHLDVGEAMSASAVPSSGTRQTWETLLHGDDYDEARELIHDLLNSAANTSAWAVALGDTGLVPGEHRIVHTKEGIATAAFHLALAPGVHLGAQARDAIAQIIRAATQSDN